MLDNWTIDIPASPQNLAERLGAIAGNRSFYTDSNARPVRITFTRFCLDQIQESGLHFRLYARCSTYRGIGILYLQIKAAFEADVSQIKASYQIGLGLPTSLFELLLGVVWNLLVISVGFVLLVSVPGLSAVERVMSYAFLPLVYGIYGLRLLYLYKIVSVEIPKVISNWCGC
jgi:hypothetical protein